MAVGPAALRVRLSSTVAETDIVAVLSDVAPNGESNAVAAGRLRSTFTEIDRSRSRTDPLTGEIVQPFNDLSRKTNVPPGEARDYYVEFWPIGNRFAEGHRIRLTLAGAPISFAPAVPAVNSIVVGGPDGAALQFPVLPGSDLCKALGAAPCPTRAADRCVAKRARLSRRALRDLRVGMSRREVETGTPRPSKVTRRATTYCVEGSKRRVSVVFSRQGERGRVRLIASGARGHRARGIRPGMSLKRVRARFPVERIGKSLWRLGAGDTRFVQARGSRVQRVAVADRRLTRSPAALRRYLRRAR